MKIHPQPPPPPFPCHGSVSDKWHKNAQSKGLRRGESTPAVTYNLHGLSQAGSCSAGRSSASASLLSLQQQRPRLPSPLVLLPPTWSRLLPSPLSLPLVRSRWYLLLASTVSLHGRQYWVGFRTNLLAAPSSLKNGCSTIYPNTTLTS